MGLVDELRGSRICIDIAPFIYYIEKDPKYLSILRPIFAEIDAGKIDALTSTITLLEVLVLPFKTKNESLAEKYREILLYTARAELRVFHDNGGGLVIVEGSSAQAICSRRLRRGQIVRGQIVRALAQLAHSRRRRRRE